MRKILLFMIGLSTVLFSGLSKNGNVVTDSSTGLQWQDNAEPAVRNWQSAIDYCEALSLDGYTDWRLPNLRELTSIVDDKKHDPSIDTAVFTHTVSKTYWSSTSSKGFGNSAWHIDFKKGTQSDAYKKKFLSVRCVRGGW